jgi:hypothetical protein
MPQNYKKCSEQQQESPLGLKVFGLACGINFSCECGARGSICPIIVADSKEKVRYVEDGKPFATRVNSGDFEINRRLLLGLQLYGDGRSDGKILAGMLNLNVRLMEKG